MYFKYFVHTSLHYTRFTFLLFWSICLSSSYQIIDRFFLRSSFSCYAVTVLLEKYFYRVSDVIQNKIISFYRLIWKVSCFLIYLSRYRFEVCWHDILLNVFQTMIEVIQYSTQHAVFNVYLVSYFVWLTNFPQNSEQWWFDGRLFSDIMKVCNWRYLT